MSTNTGGKDWSLKENFLVAFSVLSVFIVIAFSLIGLGQGIKYWHNNWSDSVKICKLEIKIQNQEFAIDLLNDKNYSYIREKFTEEDCEW